VDGPSNVKLQLNVKKTEQNKAVVDFQRVEGNPIYYKLLVNDIKNQFKQSI
jgi:hypothetical protein